jgi:hypothetical protein
MESCALLLIIPDVENNEGILTGKLFEYLATYNPIIGIGPVKGDAAKIINTCKSGEMFERNQIDELCAFISSLIEKWKRGEKTSVDFSEVNKFSRREQAKELASYL